jgi:hypothetical protein
VCLIVSERERHRTRARKRDLDVCAVIKMGLGMGNSPALHSRVEMGMRKVLLQGYLAHKKDPSPPDHHRSLGMGLL